MMEMFQYLVSILSSFPVYWSEQCQIALTEEFCTSSLQFLGWSVLVNILNNILQLQNLTHVKQKLTYMYIMIVAKGNVHVGGDFVSSFDLLLL